MKMEVVQGLNRTWRFQYCNFSIFIEALKLPPHIPPHFPGEWNAQDDHL